MSKSKTTDLPLPIAAALAAYILTVTIPVIIFNGGNTSSGNDPTTNIAALFNPSDNPLAVGLAILAAMLAIYYQFHNS